MNSLIDWEGLAEDMSLVLDGITDDSAETSGLDVGTFSASYLLKSMSVIHRDGARGGVPMVVRIEHKRRIHKRQ